MKDTPARRYLHDRMTELGLSQVALAGLLGINQSCVSQWCRGMTRPALHHCVMLLVIMGIPMEDWLTPDQRERLSEALGAIAGERPQDVAEASESPAAE